jgi:hypothetical protein
MSWYAAHIVMMVQLKEQPQERFPVWENIVLVKARSEEEAFAKAEARGHEDEGDDDGTFLWGGKPAAWVFAGVRKITSCEDGMKRPGDGTELSYLELELASARAVESYVQGEPVRVLLRDTFATTSEA